MAQFLLGSGVPSTPYAELCQKPGLVSRVMDMAWRIDKSRPPLASGNYSSLELSYLCGMPRVEAISADRMQYQRL